MWRIWMFDAPRNAQRSEASTPAKAGVHFVRLLIGLWLAVSSIAVASPGELEKLRSDAEAGDTDAQLDLALSLQHDAMGSDVGLAEELVRSDPQLVEARKWLERASASGNVEALNALGGYWLHGLGGPQDERRALAIIEDAASKGSHGALLTLSQWYRNGNDLVATDRAKAFALMQTAATAPSQDSNGGQAEAQWHLAMMILQGVGVEKNEELAYQWIVRAAEGGSVRGMTSRAVMLATGEGVTEDDEQARIWYRRAAESGDVNFANALKGLGYMMMIGEGGPVDKATGFAYLKIAAAADDENAKTLLDRYDDQLTDDLDSQSQDIANRWIAEHLPTDENGE